MTGARPRQERRHATRRQKLCCSRSLATFFLTLGIDNFHPSDTSTDGRLLILGGESDSLGKAGLDGRSGILWRSAAKNLPAATGELGAAAKAGRSARFRAMIDDRASAGLDGSLLPTRAALSILTHAGIGPYASCALHAQATDHKASSAIDLPMSPPIHRPHPKPASSEYPFAAKSTVRNRTLVHRRSLANAVAGTAGRLDQVGRWASQPAITSSVSAR